MQGLSQGGCLEPLAYSREASLASTSRTPSLLPRRIPGRNALCVCHAKLGFLKAQPTVLAPLLQTSRPRVVLQCRFHLHFSEDVASVHMLIGHVDMFSCKMHIHVFCFFFFLIGLVLFIILDSLSTLYTSCCAAYFFPLMMSLMKRNSYLNTAQTAKVLVGVSAL